MPLPCLLHQMLTDRVRVAVLDFLSQSTFRRNDKTVKPWFPYSCPFPRFTRRGVPEAVECPLHFAACAQLPDLSGRVTLEATDHFGDVLVLRALYNQMEVIWHKYPCQQYEIAARLTEAQAFDKNLAGCHVVKYIDETDHCGGYEAHVPVGLKVFTVMTSHFVYSVRNGFLTARGSAGKIIDGVGIRSASLPQGGSATRPHLNLTPRVRGADYSAVRQFAGFPSRGNRRFSPD